MVQLETVLDLRLFVPSIHALPHASFACLALNLIHGTVAGFMPLLTVPTHCFVHHCICWHHNCQGVRFRRHIGGWEGYSMPAPPTPAAQLQVGQVIPLQCPVVGIEFVALGQLFQGH